MTTQVNLDLIWASTGGVTDPGDVKYATGWISEIPTYQNFNFVLQNHSANQLVLAEQGLFSWQAEIAYVAGTSVKEGTKRYFCITDHTNQQPSLDTVNNYWIPGNVLGDAVATSGSVTKGMLVKDATKHTVGSWSGNDITIESDQPMISLVSNGVGKNWLFGTVSGVAVMVDVDTAGNPDDRDINLGQPGVYRIFHEGHAPDQTEVANTVPEAPVDGKIYSRKDSNWVQTTSTTVSAAPPPAVTGAGQGWYNLVDGQFYLDVDDGDSSQWVHANPPHVPDLSQAVLVGVTPTGNLIETDVQAALEGLQFRLDTAPGGANPNAADVNVTPTGNLIETDVQAALEGLQTRQDGKLDLTGGTLTGNITVDEVTETVHVMAGTLVDAANGTIQTRTMAGNEDPTFTLTAGQSVYVEWTLGGNTLSHTNVVYWMVEIPTISGAVVGINYFNVNGSIIGQYVGERV